MNIPYFRLLATACLVAALRHTTLVAQEKGLAVPSNLLAAQTAPTEITLVWTGVAGASEYVIYGPRTRSDLAGEGVRLGAVGASGTRYVARVVSAGVEHQYTIQAVAGKKVASQKVAFNPVVPEGIAGPAAVSPPANVTAELGDHGTVNVRWDAVPGATAYVIGREVRPNGLKTICALCSAEKTTYRDTAAVAGSVHAYSVVTVTPGGRSRWTRSNEITPVEGRRGEPVADARPEPPRDFTATFQPPQSVELTWSPVEGAASYRIHRSVGQERRFIAEVPGESGSYLDRLETAFDPAKTASVQYRIMALTGRVKSEEVIARLTGKSASDSAPGGKEATGSVSTAQPPAEGKAPSGLKASVTSPTTVRITWLPGLVNSNYKLMRRVGSAAPQVIATLPGAVSNFLDHFPPGGMPGVIGYWIEAVDGKGRSEEITLATNPGKAAADSLPGKGAAADSTPAPPSNLKGAVTGPDEVTLSWTPVPGAIYEIRRSIPGAIAKVIASLASGVGQFVDQLPPMLGAKNHSITYTVVAMLRDATTSAGARLSAKQATVTVTLDPEKSGRP